MERARSAAVQHVRVLETRIENQEALIEQRKAAGKDAAEELQRLKLLQQALREMLLHFGQLLPSEKELVHARKTAPLTKARKRS
jgi:hypothetical protein